MFYENELQKTNQIEFRIEKVIQSNNDELHVKQKVMRIHLIVELIKKDIII